ncbi:MAG TPA: hypothetical protein VGQ59_12360 [Cyclobacteriaceae bacterium]|jgi:hypothetical protein|nr:hypothetical protein [Cyclobacteriaceae bacterium]
MCKIVLSLQYCDGSNYKTPLMVKVDPLKFPEVKNIKVGNDIEMGQMGTPTQQEFFSSEIHPYPFNFNDDHNLLEVVEILNEDAVAEPSGGFITQEWPI